MTTAFAITEAITSLADVEAKFKLQLSCNEDFFTEWLPPYPDLNNEQNVRLDLIQQRYLYHRKHGHVSEGVVNLIMMSPILEMAGFCDPPFLIRSEASVKIEIEEQDKIYRGRIDILAVLEQFWVVLVESKQTNFSMSIALPQALTYLVAAPHQGQPVFGLVSNGEHFMFLKVDLQRSEYGRSDDFSVYRRHNELWDVVSILQRLGKTIQHP